MDLEKNKEIYRRLDAITETLKDLLILELGKAGFTGPEIRKVLGKIDNNRLFRITAVLNKISKKDKN